MAIGAITVLQKTQHAGLNHDVIQFPGDNAYATGGTAGFSALVQAALGKGRVQILHVVTQEAAGRTAIFDAINDKLKIYNGTSEMSAGDQSGTTYRMIVVSQ